MTPAPLTSELGQSHPATEAIPPKEDSQLPPATDNDWLRSRTSRLLGLVDDDDAQRASKDIGHGQGARKGEALANREERSSSRSVDVAVQPDVDAEGNPGADAADSTEQATNRLFVRNLAYTATGDDLRLHFERLDHGTIEEVRSILPLFRNSIHLSSNPCMSVMNV